MNKNFTIIKTQKKNDFNTPFVWLRHNRTGLTVIYSKSINEKNFFSYNFTTPISDDSGIAHVLEHCIFCGSKKYPVKHLLSELNGKSVNEIVNGYTQKTNTTYYGSTFVKKDYLNLLDVYGDAVFFPLLTEEAFLQEGWHIDLNDEGKPFINGIVYNEMNCIERRDFLSNYETLREIHPDCDECFNAGGNPEQITTLSVEKIRAFHKKYYVPSNCLLFLYTQIPMDEILDYMENILVSRLPDATKNYTITDLRVPLTQHIFKKTIPFMGDPRKSLSLNYIMKDEDNYDERDEFLYYLRDIVYNVLKNSGLGEAAYPAVSGSCYHKYFSVCLTQLNDEDIEKAKSIITVTMESLFKDNFQNERETILANIAANRISMSIEPEDIDVDSASQNLFGSWLTFKDPFLFIDLKSESRRFCSKFEKKGRSYFRAQLEKYLLNNDQQYFLIESPDKDYYTKIDESLKKQNDAVISGYSDEKIRNILSRLKTYQESRPDVQLPEIQLTELPCKTDEYELAREEEIRPGIPMLYATLRNRRNRRIYIEVCYDCTEFSSDEFISLAIFKFILSYSGIKNLSLIETEQYINNTPTRGFGRYIGNPGMWRQGKVTKDYQNRIWFSYTIDTDIKALKKSLSILEDFIYRPNLSDRQDLATAENLLKESMQNTDYSNASTWASRWLDSLDTENDRKYNEISGLNSLDVNRRLVNEDFSKILEDGRRSYEKLLKNGASLYLYAAEDLLPKAAKILRNSHLVKQLKPLKKREFETEVYTGNDSGNYGTIITPVQTGSAYMNFCCDKYPSKEYTAEDCVLNWLSENILQEEIRIKNGVYTVGTSLVPYQEKIFFYTGNDQNPKGSIEIYLKILQELKDYEFTEEQTKKMILSTYSLSVDYGVPSYDICGSVTKKLLSGFTSGLRTQRLKNLFALTPEDLHNAAVRLAELSRNYNACIITGDGMETIGTILHDYRNSSEK